jgi:DNA-binding transcriptional regulator YhcF (GntR family)
MPWNLDNTKPIYLQLMDRIQLDIISGIYKPGERLPSVRDLALKASVNPNTMQKALSELERSGILYSQRTSGRFITEDTNLLKAMKDSLAREHVRSFLENMEHLGFTKEDISELLNTIIKEDA